MTDLEWAQAFVGCKIAGTGRRFADTVDVLAKKLAEVRAEGAGNLPAGGAESETDCSADAHGKVRDGSAEASHGVPVHGTERCSAQTERRSALHPTAAASPACGMDLKPQGGDPTEPRPTA